MVQLVAQVSARLAILTDAPAAFRIGMQLSSSNLLLHCMAVRMRYVNRTRQNTRQLSRAQQQ